MDENQEKLNLLLKKLEELSKKQDSFAKEVNDIKSELNRLLYAKPTEEKSEPTSPPIIPKSPEPSTSEPIAQSEVEKVPKKPETETIIDKKPPSPPIVRSVPATNEPPKRKPHRKENEGFLFDRRKNNQNDQEPRNPRAPKNQPGGPRISENLERFIGENLINKIGIIITIIGVAIGVKYSIDHDLISPRTRIVSGYLFGVGLMLFGIKLKQKYEELSAVLVSGAIAILYFITYSAYEFYELIPQVMAFILMVIFTSFSVLTAIKYNRQIIAHIGLVGAYGVPFLLSTGSGRFDILFSYMVVINIGILFISLKKYWKPLYYVSFGLTWVIYMAWWAFNYENQHFNLAFTFLFLFYLIFYATFVGYKIVKKEKFVFSDVIMIVLNSFLFFGLGYVMIDRQFKDLPVLGLFTVGNAAIHFVVAAIIKKRELSDKSLFYLLIGMVLVFITIAIPIQLDGNWVTLLWAGEAAVMFWIGRTKKISIYEYISYPLIVLALASLTQDWLLEYHVNSLIEARDAFTSFVNVHFLSSALVMAAIYFIFRTNRKNSVILDLNKNRKGIYDILDFALPTILFLGIYLAFRLEILYMFKKIWYLTSKEIWFEESNDNRTVRNIDLRYYRQISLILFAAIYVSVISFLNITKWKEQTLAYVNFVVNLLFIFAFLTQGLYALSELRESYLGQQNTHFPSGSLNILIRYISFGFLSMVVYVTYQYAKSSFISDQFRIILEIGFHIMLAWIISSELLHWMDYSDTADSYKLALSILWGIYSLALVAIGIMKKKKHLRIAGISFFGITLVKLIMYDISHLNTISKTIVLVTLGILLLITSYLYNKFKSSLFDEKSEK